MIGKKRMNENSSIHQKLLSVLEISGVLQILYGGLFLASVLCVHFYYTIIFLMEAVNI